MKFDLHGSLWRLLVVLLCVLSGGAEAKPIRLRNEVIEPDSPSARAAVAAASASDQKPARGLFLIQFTEAPRSEWRDQLRTLGVELLRFVPEDAFVAKFEGVPPDQLRKFSFVTAVTAFRPAHKLHARLAGATTNAPEVAVLLSPKASAAELAEVKQLFDSASQKAEFRAGCVVRGRLQPTQLDALARSDAALWIEPAPRMKLVDEVASRIVGGAGPPHKTLVQSLGYDGAGVTVAVADSGLDSGDTNSMHPDIQGRVAALLAYGSLPDAADEHSHGTHVAGIVAGNGATGETDGNGFLYGLGVAPGARLVAQRIFDADGGYVLPPTFDFETLTRDAKRAGADIGSNSWGDDTQGQYDLSAMRFDELVRDADELALGDQPYILEFSAGNAGPGVQTVGSPAVAKNVIATGASQNDRFNLPLPDFAIYNDGRDAMCDFSSRGPCADGRIKPDLVAPGSWIASLRSVYANDNYAWWPISDHYLYQGGTSQAGPHVSGAAAVFVQYWRSTRAGATPSPALVKAALINSATDMNDASGTAPVPNMDEGWGRVDLPALLTPTRDYEFTDQTVLLTNGGVFEKRVLIGSVGEPLKITLAYTDVRGFPAAGIALVNDLDLEVVSPNGHLYRGNRFDNGESIADATGADTINNVEAVHLLAPVPGEYIVRVRGSRVVEDARRDTVAVDQDFALVISGRFGAPGVGIVTFDRRVYRAPDLIKLALVDYDLAGQGTASVLVRSGAEPAGELLTLHADGASGVFTGAIATAIGPAVSDGTLQVANSNVIEAVYADALPPSNRVFTARVDLLPPVISGLQATNSFGQVAVSWNTDEPARSELYYGPATPSLGLTNRTLDVTHEFALANVPAQAVVKFFVVAQDEAGNRSTNDNGGAFFTITNTQPPQILLVDSFADYLGLVAAPPLSGYTDALNVIGAAYDFFDARSGALPSPAQLNAHRCVIWRMSDLDVPSVALAQSISNYVKSGGSLLIASMEALSRFTDASLAGFNTGVLHVQSFTADQPVDSVFGVPGEPLGNGINATLDYSLYADILALAGTSNPSDWIVPDTNAAAAMLSGSAVVGLRAPKIGVNLPGRVVFLSFPLDAVPLGSGLGNNRAGLLRNILNFLAPPANTSTLTLDSDVYSLPGRAVVEVEDAVMQGAGQLAVTVHSPQHTNPLALPLLETARPGLFRGSVVFVATNTAAPGTCRVDANDTVQFDYFDAAAGLTVSATATIQTNRPVITNVLIEPGYLEAVVTWDTSEPADSLVQYSEAPDGFPNNFTAFDPTRTTAHSVFLAGLKPNTTYHARLSSRDRAGNATTDDNHGSNYTFTTLLPLTPPWFDDMETNNLAWSTFASADSETNWARGVPGGGATAHSGTNCWGSNLSGGPLSQLETYLFSPGVFLTGGNKATLRFWHNYDFTSKGAFDIELAALEIITNVSTAPLTLVQMPAAASAGWEPFEVDLTPFLGNVVYLVWYHFLFSFDAPPRLGWLVDDVSITTETVVPGTVQVTNNISQAVFALSGPSGRLGNGLWTRITNAVPGQYVIQFGDAPYFNTPAPQTNTLAAGGTVTFAGNYTFPDANSNGIPDGWELANFGVIDPHRTATTDTDGDGLSDYGEFVAGTDPNNPPPPFRLTAQQTHGFVTLSWPSPTNLMYRIGATTTLPGVNWQPYSGWLNPTSFLTSFTLPAPTNGAPNSFRVEAAPNGPLAGWFRVSAHSLTNGLFRLDWPSAPGHGYRVYGSADSATWMPFSDWVRASGYTTSLTLPPPTNGAPSLFRVEARP